MSSDFEDVKMDDNPPKLIDFEFHSVKTTLGYRCGKCCGFCCDTKYMCCNGPGSKCTPTSVTTGIVAISAAGGGISAILTSGMICCWCIDPNCIQTSIVNTTGLASGGFLAISLTCGLKLGLMYLADTYCGRITHHLGCGNFSQGFDEKIL